MTDCSMCGQDLPPEMFSPDRRRPSGKKARCKKCCSSVEKERYKKNPEKIIERVTQKRKQWPEDKKKATWAKQNAQRRGGFVVLSVSEKDIRRMKSSPCFICKAKEDIELDHVVPVSRGGRHSVGNLQPLCRKCNRRKWARFMIEVRAGRW